MMKVEQAAVLVVLLLAGAAGCGRSPQATRDRHLERGKRFLEAKEYSRAILELRNAARAMPDDAEVYHQIGTAAVGSGDLRLAIASFRKALDLNPKHTGAQLRMAQIMTASGDPGYLKDAESRLRTLMEGSQATPEMLNTLALTELGLGKIDEAAQTLEQVLVDAPQELRSSVMLARARLLQKDVKGAEEVLKKACDAAPNSADARVFLGRFYLTRNRAEEAAAEFQHALKLNPESTAALMDLAKLQTYLGRTQEAEASFKRMAGMGKDYRSIYALFLFQQRRRDEAIREMERLTQEDPDDRQARTILVAAYRDANRIPDAEKILAEALKKNSKDLEALLQRGELYLAAGKADLAEADLNQVLRLRPDAPEAHYVVAKLHQSRGAALRYRQELNEALKLNPYLVTIRSELAQALIASKQAKAALDLMNATPQAQRELVPVLIQRNWAFWALGDLQEMRKGIDLALSRERSTELLLQDGLWKLRQGTATGARAALEEALKFNPSDIRALEGLRQTYGKQGTEALKRVKELAAQHPKSAPVQQFLGVLQLASGERNQARAAFAAAKQADPKLVSADLSLVQLDMVDGKLDDARTKLQSVVNANGNDRVARLWLGQVEYMKGNQQAAIDHLRKVLESDPENTQALNNLAYLLSEFANRPDEALKLAQRAVELSPQEAAYSDTLGWILYRKGVYKSAIQYLERADKADVVTKYHLAMAYAKAGQTPRGQAILKEALKQDPNRPEAKMALEILEEPSKPKER
jgi:tetratricopeptide (TPR) repeat protein